MDNFIAWLVKNAFILAITATLFAIVVDATWLFGSMSTDEHSLGSIVAVGITALSLFGTLILTQSYRSSHPDPLIRFVSTNNLRLALVACCLSLVGYLAELSGYKDVLVLGTFRFIVGGLAGAALAGTYYRLSE